jgi:hypothetical protein
MSVWTLRLRIVREIKHRKADDTLRLGMSPVLFSPVITARGKPAREYGFRVQYGRRRRSDAIVEMIGTAAD